MSPAGAAAATVRTKVTRGAGSPAAALAMALKLAESAQARWRAITAPHLVALVRAGAHFENGHLVEPRGTHGLSSLPEWISAWRLVSVWFLVVCFIWLSCRASWWWLRGWGGGS